VCYDVIVRVVDVFYQFGIPFLFEPNKPIRPSLEVCKVHAKRRGGLGYDNAQIDILGKLGDEGLALGQKISNGFFNLSDGAI